MNWLEWFGIDDTPDKNPMDDIAEIGKIYSSILQKDSAWDLNPSWGLPEIKE